MKWKLDGFTDGRLGRILEKIKNRPLLVAFLIPFLACILICIGDGIYPFGQQSMLHIDMYHQYLPFFSELLHKIRTGGSLMYSWNIGLGSDFISVFAYYMASPINWLIVFCPSEHVLEFMELVIIIKISACGATFFYYIREHFGFDRKMYGAAYVFSTAYALSGFMAAYSWNIMWLDVVVLAPLVILGLERLVKQGRCGLYFVCLGISIYSNYYLSIMLCIYLVFYFVYLFLVQKQGRWIAALRFAVYSLLAGGVGAVMMLPELKILSYSGSSGIEWPQKMQWYYNPLTELPRMCVTANNYTGLDHWVNIYAGTFSILLLVLFFVNHRVSWKKKVPALGMILVFMLSFANNYLDFIWHGFHFPNSLPGRQTYLFAFMVLFLGFYTIFHKKDINLIHTGIATVITLGLVIGGACLMDTSVTDWYTVIIGCLLIVVYAIIVLLIKLSSNGEKRLFRKFLTGIALVELFVGMAVNGFGNTSRTEYMENQDDIEELLEMAQEDADNDGVKFYRVEDTQRLTKNDDTRYGYKSATQFSSLMNINVSHFYQKVYMEGGKNFYGYNGATPIPSAMLSVRYFISTSGQLESPLRSLVGKAGDHYLYKNNYWLPIGYVVSEEAADNLDLSTAIGTTGIDNLGRSLGADNDTMMYADCYVTAEEGKTQIKFAEDGYFYANTKGSCATDRLTIKWGESSVTWSKTSHRYLLELGSFKKGDSIEISNSDGERVDFKVYKLNLQSVQQSFDTLSQEEFQLDSVSDTSIEGHVDMSEAGRLVLSVPLEEGWSLYVDGSKQEAEAFADTFISVSLSEGEHNISLRYTTPGLGAGAAISGGSIILFILLTLGKSKLKRRKYSHEEGKQEISTGAQGCSEEED